jgi:hypothetical protein
MSSTLFQRPFGEGALTHLDAVGNQHAIREQLDRILESPGFRNSRRYPNLLRHVVERTLQGQSGDLKERSLGIDVFGRSPDYDPSVDPVVRVSAGEIRKRIAQYYHEAGHEGEIRIDLPLGSYLPEFHLPKSKADPDDSAVVAPLLPAQVTPAQVTPALVIPATVGASHRRTLGVAIAVILVMAAGAWLRPWVRPSGMLDQFWAPVLNPSVPVILCVGRAPLSAGSMATPDQLGARPAGIGWSDAATLARLTGLIQFMGQPYQLRREERTTFSELQESPAVLVGAFNDAWTLRLMDGMRFGFHQDGTQYWIADQQDPGARRWKIDLNRKDAEGRPVVGEDYALISRFLNPRTGKIVVVVAGLYAPGTEAAGRFLTDARQMQSLTGHVQPQWQRKNLQIVIRTEVIERTPGPARVLAAYSW